MSEFDTLFETHASFVWRVLRRYGVPERELCSFPLDGAPSCVNLLQNGPGRMQAPAPNVLYIWGPGGFSRYAF